MSAKKHTIAIPTNGTDFTQLKPAADQIEDVYGTIDMTDAVVNPVICYHFSRNIIRAADSNLFAQ